VLCYIKKRNSVREGYGKTGDRRDRVENPTQINTMKEREGHPRISSGKDAAEKKNRRRMVKEDRF